MVGEQLSLLGGEATSFDAEFRSMRRIELADAAWLDVAPAWLRGHAAVFDALMRFTAWRHERRVMYERELDVPRLYGVLPDGGPGHPLIEEMRRALSARYATAFERVSLALYRDGRDSVAWHGDRIARRLPTALVASVSVGAPRRFLLRPYPRDKRAPASHGAGKRSVAMTLGWGDLLVMGGTCQRTWQHSIPKVASAPSRIVIMFRPVWVDDRRS